MNVLKGNVGPGSLALPRTLLLLSGLRSEGRGELRLDVRIDKARSTHTHRGLTRWRGERRRSR